jgi:hypothetical protein
MSARVVAILLATNAFTAIVSVVLAWFLEPLKGALVRWWQGRDLRRHKGDFWLWSHDPPKEVDHE